MISSLQLKVPSLKSLAAAIKLSAFSFQPSATATIGVASV